MIDSLAKETLLDKWDESPVLKSFKEIGSSHMARSIKGMCKHKNKIVGVPKSALIFKLLSTRRRKGALLFYKMDCYDLYGFSYHLSIVNEFTSAKSKRH